MSDLFDRLQSALGDTYRLDTELSGGGMSRVFLAEEKALNRKVVIKLLPPEMAAGVNIDRFEREIQLAASLQHPHVVPLLTAGSHDDLLYYVMPFIEGESLRAKLAREGELPIGETLRILRDVADALAYAHRHKVVHRDIKPDNVMLSDDHALVTDFGVAKAVTDSTGGQSLTSMGVALGTPAYMSPEQAAANPQVDHRADIYALGALAYEMLCGRPPFSGVNPQQVLAAHVTQAPDPCTTHRTSVPAGLNELVMRCLAKLPADRWQRADELKTQFDSLATPPSGGVTPTGTQPVAAVPSGAAGPVGLAAMTPVKVAVLFGAGAAFVLVLVYMLMTVLGLPSWVFVGAIALLAVGLPIMLVTGRHEQQRAVAATTGMHVTTPVGVRKHFTWRRATLGGGLAFAGLTVVTGGFMAMRMLGIGPVGTLVASGVLDEQARLVLADFENATSDSTLGETVAELFRIDLNESPAITLLSTGQVANVLARMERPEDSPLTPGVASEIAIREGIKAYLTGDIRSLGESYLLAARLVSAETGEEFMSVSEQANTSADIMEAVDRMSTAFRERIGESYSSLRADPPLERFTTSSLEALQLYAQATRASEAGNLDRAIALLEQPVAIDSAFAMAWRRLGAFMVRPGRGQGSEGRDAIRRAYALRERLAERERYHVEALHGVYVEEDNDKAVTAYLTILDKYPRDATALNNLGVAHARLGNRRESARWYREGIVRGVAPAISYTNLIGAQTGLGDLTAADTVLELFEAKFPDHASRFTTRAQLAAASWDYESAAAAIDDHFEAYGSAPDEESEGYGHRSVLAAVQGKMDESQRWNRQGLFVDAERRDRFSHEVRAVVEELESADLAIWYDLDPPSPDEYVEMWDRWLETADNPMAATRWENTVRTVARLGEATRAQAMLDEYRGRLSDEQREDRRLPLLRSDAELALASDRADEAVSLLRTARDVNTIPFFDRSLAWLLAEAYDESGNADSAVVYYELYLETHNIFQLFQDFTYLPATLRRLGELYEERGDRDKAVEYYSRFVDLWAEADPELQALVDDIRGRVARLVGEEQ
jgi:tetratricopeptide (TPR) repeat protein